MKTAFKKMIRCLGLLFIAVLLLTACSRRGVHMSKHRKSRKCDCPTFAQDTHTTSSAYFAYYAYPAQQIPK